MITLTGTGKAQTCDGVTRRDFMQVGALGAVGLGLPQYMAAKAAGRSSPTTTALHHDLQPRQAEPARHV
ncbi:MAG: twin-arginine translocation signal domain-containing protein [Planctomycetaceae bacterium]